MRVCVLHADEERRSDLVARLERRGCEVRAFPSMCESLTPLADFEPHLVLVEHPAGGDGSVSLLRQVHRRHPHIIMVALLPGEAEESAIDALANGASNYLQEPLNPRLLDVILERYETRIANEERHSQVLNLIVRNRTEIQLPSDPNIVPCVVEYIVDHVQENFRNTDTNGIRLGLEEILRNAIEHGNLEIGFVLKEQTLADGTFIDLIEQRRHARLYASRLVRIDYRIEGTVFHCCIEDEGMGFDYEDVWDPLSSEGLARLNGRGIFLARTFFDSVTYTGRGNHVEMIKDLAAEAMSNAASGTVNGSLT
ncbi:MAG: hypothetical protein PWP23_1625 [Candidatus Sumerlaeota bacterium]|nr:hypothetical protein [Candidatus Sumerlaeota bacterium]